MKTALPYRLLVVTRACLLLLVTVLVPARAAAEQPYVLDDAGRPLRVVFPLHDRVALDGFLALSSPDETEAPNLQRGLRLQIKHSFAHDDPDAGVWWRFRHSWLGTEISTDPNHHLRTTLLSASYLRHDESSFLVLPNAPRFRLPAPFDIAFEYRLLDLTVAPLTLQLDVLQAAVLLDFIRDPAARHRLAIGPVASYGIARTDENTSWTHSFSPATGGRLVYGWESPTGRFQAQSTLECAFEAELIAPEIHWQTRCQGALHGEWTVMAVNDAPIALTLSASAGDHVQAELGLRWSLPAGRRPYEQR